MSRRWQPPDLDPRYLTSRDRNYYRRLADAYEQVAKMSDLGLVAEDLLEEIRRRITRVAILIDADGTTTALGGRRSNRLRRYMGDLTDLMVDLVDAAVDHQTAALYNDSVVSVTLRELEQRHTARGAGHDEVADW